MIRKRAHLNTDHTQLLVQVLTASVFAGADNFTYDQHFFGVSRNLWSIGQMNRQQNGGETPPLDTIPKFPIDDASAHPDWSIENHPLH